MISQIEKDDSLAINTTLTPELEPTKTSDEIKFADTGLKQDLIYGAVDSQRFDNKNSTVHLFGSAYVKYENREIKADYIILNIEKNIASAHSEAQRPNAIKPIFSDGGKEYQYDSLKYNFETEKGLMYEVVGSEGEFYIHGKKTKYVSGGSDKFSNDDVVYNQGATITTCNHDHPHFGFRARRMKVVKDKVAVVGPSNLELGGVSTPIWLPFGFFPLVQGKSSGFIFPQDYEFNSRTQGFGIRGFGWYFPINDYVHTTITGDIYTRGSHALYSRTQYRKRYKYSGSINLSYNDQRIDGEITNIIDGEQITEVGTLSNKGFTIQIKHDQDPKAHPFVKIGGSINIVGNDNQNRNFNDAGNVLTRTYRSNFYYRHSMPGTPFNFSLGLDHGQNTNTGVMNITLPDIALNMNTIYPFKRKNKGSNAEKWYEKISFDYDAKFKSLITTTDTTLFSRETLENMKTGLSQKTDVGFSARVLKYFNIVPNANYEEITVLNSIERRIDTIFDRVDTTIISEFNDTILTRVIKDTIIDRTLTGLESYRTFRAGVDINTQLFATAQFKKGWLRGIRQTIKPRIGYSFAPDTRSLFIDTLNFIADPERTPITYSRFDNGPFGNPRLNDLTSQITFGVNSILELKHWSKKDSTTKKFKLFDNISGNGSYNFAKDSLKWSTFSFNTTSRFFKGMTQITTSWTLDPYLEKNNRAINQTVWSDRKQLFRLERGNINIANRLSMDKIIGWFQGNDIPDDFDPGENSNRQRTEDEEGPPGAPGQRRPTVQQKRLTRFADVIKSIKINWQLVYAFSSVDDVQKSELATNSLTVTGTLPLTENWSINIGNLGYDFAGTRGLTYTDISFVRKLHCWNMRFSWSPNSNYYSFFIGVNSSNLSFLKYNYGQNALDGLSPFGRRF